MNFMRDFKFFSASNAKIGMALILGIYCLFGLSLRFQILDFFYFNEWVARDFDRAINLFEGLYIPLAGPELDNGGRLPGPFLYFLMAIPLFFNKSFVAIAQFNFLLNALAVFIMFVALKKHFGFFVASLFTVLVSIYLPHINVFGYPINPSFLFPFIALFIWLTLNFVVNENELFFPLIILVVSLGIQLHYSMATFYAVPLSLIFLYRIKISRRCVLLILFVLLMVFLPYLFYKTQTFIPSPPIKNQFAALKMSSFLSLGELFDVVFLKKTMLRITYYNGMEGRRLFSNWLVLTYYFLIYSTLLYWAIKIYKKGIQFYKKELTIFLTFYIPAFFYEIARPYMAHLWYCYIFIFPTFTLISLFFCEVFKDLKGRVLKAVFVSLISAFTLYITNCTYTEFKEYRTQEIRKDFKYTYQNTNYFIKSVLDHLKITEEDFYKKVFIDFDRFGLFSKRRLEFLDRRIKNISYDKNLKNTKDCFYLFDLSIKRDRFQNKVKVKNPRLNALFEDESIKIKSFDKNNLKIIYRGHVMFLGVITYSPKNSGQKCYTNNQNPFAVDNEIRQLLIDTKRLSDAKKPIAAKVLTSQRNFDENSKLVNLNEEFLIFKRTIQAPIKFTVNIRRNDDGYDINTKVLIFSYYLGKRLELKDVSLLISNSQDGETKSHRFNIIDDKSFVQEMMGYNPYSIQLNWEKNFKSPESLNFMEKLFSLNLAIEFSAKENYGGEITEEDRQNLNISLSSKLDNELASGDMYDNRWRNFPLILKSFM